MLPTPCSFQFKMFLLEAILQSQIMIDLQMNRMECFFAMVDQSSEIAGSYYVETDQKFNFSYRISSQKEHNLFESMKLQDHFVVPAVNPGVYRLCFTTLETEDENKTESKNETQKPLVCRLTFDMNVIKVEKQTTDKLGQVLSNIDDSVTKIQGEYRDVRKQEQELQSNMKSAKFRMWLMFFVEVICILAAVGSQTLYITRLHKRV